MAWGVKPRNPRRPMLVHLIGAVREARHPLRALGFCDLCGYQERLVERGKVVVQFQLVDQRLALPQPLSGYRVDKHPRDRDG